MQYVAYISIPTGPGMAPMRWYLQESGSFGWSVPFHETPEYVGPVCTLDSRVLLFKNPKEAIAVLNAFRGTDPTHRCSTFGFHGITEAGNACEPFQVVHKGEDRTTVNREIGMAMYKAGEWAQALQDLGIPAAWVWSPAAVGRKKVLLPYQAVERLQHHIENQLPEDELAIRTGIENLQIAGWTFTEVDIHGHLAFLHMSRCRNEREEHASAMIYSLNLMDDQAIKEHLEAQNDRTV